MFDFKLCDSHWIYWNVFSLQRIRNKSITFKERQSIFWGRKFFFPCVMGEKILICRWRKYLFRYNYLEVYEISVLKIISFGVIKMLSVILFLRKSFSPLVVHCNIKKDTLPWSKASGNDCTFCICPRDLSFK